MRVFIHYQLDTFHICISSSVDTEAKFSPFGENAMLVTGLLWAVRVLIHSPFEIFQMRIDSSLEPDAKKSPFGENDRLVIVLL